MSTLTLALLTQLASSCPAAPVVPFDRVKATVEVESGYQALAIHENWPLHSRGRSYLPATKAEAVALVAALHAQGHSVDAGLTGLNDANWSRLGLTAETVFEPRTNVCAGMAMLAEAYAVERRVSCRYNTGHPDCANGYPERIAAAEARIAQGDAGSDDAVPPAPEAAPPPVVIDMLHATASPAETPGSPVNLLAPQPVRTVAR